MAARVRWRGKTTARGYGSDHQKLRARWAPTVQAGQAQCHAAVCLMASRWIPPDQAGQPTGWHLGHTADRTGWTGPEHLQCNIADANRRRGRHQRPALWITSRRW